jgi:murein DD-endopeptidase MepM/ murein hydrolase activator NlpD
LTNTSGCGVGKTSYDEHPGYDYRAALNTPVYAAANGTVVNNVNNGGTMCVLTNISSCANFNYVGIDHGNGYISQYGYLSQIYVTPGQSVVQGQQIGLSGDTGVPNEPHLHFEVIKLIPGQPNNYAGLNYAVVDPYGWVGGGTDPLYSVGLGIPPAKLWQ